MRPTTGAVIVGGREVAAMALRVGMAFQNPTMLAWLTIGRNVMLPLKIVEPYRSQYAAKRKGEFRDKAHALLDEVGLKGFASSYPWQLSGGMLQRANLCRALIHEPRLMLPFTRPRTIANTFEPDFVALNQRLRELIVNMRNGAAPEAREPAAWQRARRVTAGSLSAKPPTSSPWISIFSTVTR